MYEKANVNVAAIPALLKKYKGALSFKTETTPYFQYRKMRKMKKETDDQIIDQVVLIIEDILSLSQH